MQRVIYRQISVVAYNVHAESDGCVYYRNADAAETDNAESLAFELVSLELALSLFYLLCYVIIE